ncbi:MAG: MFS transporter [Bacteroidota bacterium]|nr:MFS transporter [Bacteroidota bacterium]
MIIISVNQLLWITFAPITSEAVRFFGVSDLKIGILSMCFMIVYIVVSIPASWIIDTYGIRIGVGTGAVLTGVFGLLRGFASPNYSFLLVAQIGIATGQPFLMNAITKVAARWFPIGERATAAGLGTLSSYLGILIGMILTPWLVEGSGITKMLNLYGILAVLSALVFLLFVRERPPVAPYSTDQEERALAIDGLRLIFKNKDFNWLMFIFFIGLGAFNTVTTWIENILHPRGFSSVQAGMTGGFMIIGGILGALILPFLSDRLRKRTPFIMIALAGAAISLIGIALVTNYFMVLLSGLAFGFFLLSSGPIGFQYGAEITYPISEGTSNGFLLLVGQISGILFIFGMNAFKSPATGSMTKPLVVLIILMVFSFLASTRIRESVLIKGADK